MHTTMTNDVIEKNWKKFLKCKECWEFKELNLDNWYNHSQWFMWVLWRCKECIKRWRHSERELIMARKRDINRWRNNPHRHEYILKNNSIRRCNKWYWNIHLKVSRLMKRLWIERPKQCTICWCENVIYAHHPDYNNVYEVVFVCQPCHSKIHSWKIQCPKPVDLKSFYIFN